MKLFNLLFSTCVLINRLINKTKERTAIECVYIYIYIYIWPITFHNFHRNAWTYILNIFFCLSYWLSYWLLTEQHRFRGPWLWITNWSINAMLAHGIWYICWNICVGCLVIILLKWLFSVIRPKSRTLISIMSVEGFESLVRNKITKPQYKCSMLAILLSFLTGSFLVATCFVQLSEQNLVGLSPFRTCGLYL
jgi:hypothetical protein